MIWRALLILLGMMLPLSADPLDDFVQQEMKAHQIPGVSIAIVQEGKVTTRVYGVTTLNGSPVTPETLFQAGSISKVATAVAALMLVQQGKLSLDGDVNAQLKDWKVPESPLTEKEKVTVRRLLSHTAGLSVHGFEGYARGVPVPSLTDVLDGTGGSNSRPVRVVGMPGSKLEYSGGGYTILQKLMIDVTGLPFPELMNQLVLGPLHMTRSSFEQTLSADQEKVAATGYYPKQVEVPGQWHTYPEMAAAGLWSTPSDLALLLLAVEQAQQGKTDGVISPTISKEMAAPVIAPGGTGWQRITKTKPDVVFYHGGTNEGFESFMQSSSTGGVIVMMNANVEGNSVYQIAAKAWTNAGIQPAW